jgi:hypothetical protein
MLVSYGVHHPPRGISVTTASVHGVPGPGREPPVTGRDLLDDLQLG